MGEVKKLYYTISEVADMFNVKTSLVRYWEKEFPRLIKPKRNKKNNRLFTQKDIDNFRLIYYYVKEVGMTLKGAKKIINQHVEEQEVKSELIKRLNNIKQKLLEIKQNI